MRPHVEKNAKNFKIGWVIAIFVRLTKIQIRVNKNQENAFFGHFWIDTKKSYFINFFKPKYHESSKTEYSDSTSFINRLTPLIFFFRVLKFFRGAKRGVPPKNFAFCLLLSHENRLTWNFSLLTASYDDYSCQNLTKKMPEGIFAPPWIGLTKLT